MLKINMPNKLTISRLILVIPFIVVLSFAFASGDKFSYKNFNNGTIYYLLSGIIFMFAMITDFVDGYLARKNNLVTTFGKIFDPLADKFMTTTALIMLSVGNIVPFWITLIFILRDILVDGLRTFAATNKVDVSASIWGKAKTMLQSLAIITIFFLLPALSMSYYDIASWNWDIIWLNLPLIGAAILSVVSGWKYIGNMKHLINLN